MRVLRGIETELEDRVERLGFEVVEVRWGGTSRRPVLQLRIDRPDAAPGHGVTVEDCATVSRALEPWLDEMEEMPERYVLEVSSPGVERPLTRDRDFERFRGEKVALRGYDVLAGRARRLEGELLGLEEDDSGQTRVRLQMDNGDEVSVPRSEIERAHLVFTWT